MREQLSDERVRIRRYCAEDVDALFEAATGSIPESPTWLPWLCATFSAGSCSVVRLPTTQPDKCR